jgi:GNAT superfamily N-acetyltransferase
MGQKLNDFSSTAMSVAIEESLCEFWAYWGAAPQSELFKDSHMLRLYTGVPYAFCNGVICSQFPIDKIDTVIDETIAYYQVRGATWEWMVGPQSVAASLDKFLLQHGLSEHGESIGMAINLDAIVHDIPLVNHLSLIPVEDELNLNIWVNTMIAGFEAPALNKALIDLESSLGCHQQYYRHYLGLFDQQPVATSALYIGESVAGIYCVSTVPSARGLGIGAAITQVALRDARALGYHVAVLQSSPMGHSVYSRLGFQDYSILRAFRP